MAGSNLSAELLAKFLVSQRRLGLARCELLALDLELLLPQETVDAVGFDETGPLTELTGVPLAYLARLDAVERIVDEEIDRLLLRHLRRQLDR